MADFAAIKRKVDTVLTEKILSDSTIAVRITYKRFSGVDRDTGTKSSTNVYDEMTAPCFKVAKLIPFSGQNESHGVELHQNVTIYKTLLRHISDEVDGSDLSLKDRIVDNEKELRVIGIVPNFGVVTITCAAAEE